MIAIERSFRQTGEKKMNVNEERRVKPEERRANAVREEYFKWVREITRLDTPATSEQNESHN
jgi:hypothetical protein